MTRFLPTLTLYQLGLRMTLGTSLYEQFASRHSGFSFGTRLS
jgi:hypothetical protein